MAKLPSEFDLIKTFFAPLTAFETGAFNLSDDAAVLAPRSEESLVVTNDALVEGVHFLATDNPADIAAKLLRVSLSDLAAMGASPAFYNLAIAVPSELNADWFEAFCGGLAADQKEFGITLIGGDTVSTKGVLTLSLTAMGYVQKGRSLRRNGAKIGDDIWVSGSLGDGALGLLVAQGKLNDLSPDDSAFLLDRYRRPQPRVKLGSILQKDSFVHAAMDVSDGLIADLNHLCEASQTGADIFIADLPLSKPLENCLDKQPQLIDLVLGGGDDYELLFTADPTFANNSKSIFKACGHVISKIGKVTNHHSIRIFNAQGDEQSLSQTGFTHF